MTWQELLAVLFVFLWWFATLAVLAPTPKDIKHSNDQMLGAVIGALFIAVAVALVLSGS